MPSSASVAQTDLYEVKLAAAQEGALVMKSAHLEVLKAKDEEVKRLQASNSELVKELKARDAELKAAELKTAAECARADKFELAYNVNRADHQRMFEQLLASMRSGS